MSDDTTTPTPSLPPKPAGPSPHAVARTAESKQGLSNSAKDWPSDWITFIFCALAGMFMLWRAGVTGAVGLTFKPDIASSVPVLLGSLLLVSLFVERVVEVFVSVWSDRQTVIHQQNIDYWQTRHGRFEQDVQKLIAERDGPSPPDATRKAKIDELLEQKHSGIEEADTNADAEAKALLPFKARTRKVTTWVGLVIGVFTAAVGFRFLTQLVDISTIYKPAEKLVSDQHGWFVAADVLLTGAVLAGGSKLIHEIFAVYESFMQSTQKSLSDKSKK